jgi:hypothetical protein
MERRVVLRRQIWATDCGEIRSRAEAVVNAGTRTWRIGNTRKEIKQRSRKARRQAAKAREREARQARE